MTAEWPKRIMTGNQRAYNLDTILHFRQTYACPDERRSMHADDARWLCGYILPPFQRELVWDEARMIRFIESAVLGFDLGSWAFNNATDFPMTSVGDRKFWHHTDRWLLDGQQRLTALDRFFGDAFPVFGLRWSEVGGVAQRRFLAQTAFSAHEFTESDEMVLRELYDRMNFGGVPHREDQRAMPAVSGGERVRHLKRGSTYAVVGDISMQVSVPGKQRVLKEGDIITAYRADEDGKLWGRFADEFRDGRFITIKD